MATRTTRWACSCRWANLVVASAGAANEGGGGGGRDGTAAPAIAAGEVPTEEDIRNCIADLHALARFTPGCLVVALIYMERLRRGRRAAAGVDVAVDVPISIIVAQKVW